MGLFKKKKPELETPVTQTEQDTSVGTAADVEAVMKKYDRESNTRVWEGAPSLVIRTLMALRLTPLWTRCFSPSCPSAACLFSWACCCSLAF